jgi:3-methyl-2-oxobutanoate hydroxymethyltransferase
MDIVNYFLQLHTTKKKIAVLTAYDLFTASLCVEAGIDAVLVGDSLGNVIQGLPSTSGVLVEDMVYHTRIVSRICNGKIPVIADFPANSYKTKNDALWNAKRLFDAGADAVKLEGSFPEIIRALVNARFPVMGHIGLLPQTAASFTVQGKTEEDAARIISDAKEIEKAGAFSVVVECVPSGLGKSITDSIGIPVIGIGAGSGTSGQVLVIHDLLGMSTGKKARFVKANAQLLQAGLAAVKQYRDEVTGCRYPDDDHSYH